MLVLAQAAERLPVPEVEFGVIAPELLLAGVALLALLLAVAGGARTIVGAVGGAIAIAVGVWLVIRGQGAAGAIVVATGAGVVAAEVGLAARPPLAQAWVAALGVLGAFALTVWQWSALYQQGAGGTYLSGSIALDGVAIFTRAVVLLTALLVVPIGYGYLLDRGIQRLEFEPLLLFSVIGMTVLAASADLLVAFVAYELLSLPLYILAGLALRDRRSQEASVKYFLMGAVTSAVLVYGIALVYTGTGTLDVGFVAAGVALVTVPRGVVMLGLALLTVGLGFKAAAVPFHFWTPDVYQGAPSNVTAFMAAATKAAAFALILRVYLAGFGRVAAAWVPVLAAIAAATMMVGALAAIVQRDVKRVLAYSSVAHVGYALVGVTSSSQLGLSATLFYLLTYAVSAVGAFGCVVAIERRRRGEVALVDLRGLGRTSPVLAGVFGLCLLSLAGVPATAGFAGKFAVFRAGVESGLVWLVVLGVVSSVVSAFFYLRLIGAMFLEEPDPQRSWTPVLTTGLSAGIAAAAAAVVVLGIYFDPFAALADQAATLAR